jgi:RNA polymerase sigma factor (sigma-70 family)
MPQSPETSFTQQLLNRIAIGDDTARELLISHSMERLRRLASSMLRNRKSVRRWDDTDDVLQNALIRLNRALLAVKPESPRRYIGLAATQIRRELLDLYRHHYGPEGHGAHHASDVAQKDTHGGGSPAYDSPDKQLSPSSLASIHEAIEKLPEDLREVFEMTFYQGMTQEEIASVFDVSTKTVKRRWREARLALQDLLD